MGNLSGALAKELKTIMAMAHIYCRDHHGSGADLCGECLSFIRFAEFRLAKCPYGQTKPTCKRCPIHCYRRDMKDLARSIMTYSGPRMLVKHPYLAIRHLLHDRQPVPPLPRKKKEQTGDHSPANDNDIHM